MPGFSFPFQFHTFLRNGLLHNTSVSKGHLNEKGSVAVDFDIVTWMGFPNHSVVGVKVGSVERQASPDLKLTIDQDTLVFPKRLNQVWKSISSFNSIYHL